jgi:predicted nucleotidyltransferase component of viral defense system
MLTESQLRNVAARSGARDITKVEIDVILTYLLALLEERGITGHLAFKGGTMLRKMVFGPRGRYSTDLDFTACTDISRDNLMLMMLDAVAQPFNGLSFRFDRDKDWYFTDDGIAANPVCAHAANEKGEIIKIQVSMREQPVLSISPLSQLDQDYFKLLPFKPGAVPSLTYEEAVAEKIRAASQRSKIRDLHDLSEIAARPLNRNLVRALAVIKLWESNGDNLDYGLFSDRIAESGDYDLGELTNLLRRDQRPDLDDMMDRVIEGFRFLGNLTDLERALAQDKNRSRGGNLDALKTEAKKMAGEG